MTTIKTLLSNRSLLILGAAESISGIGDWITMMAVFAILVFRGDGGLAESSGVYLAGLLPLLVASPVAGWLVDRFDRRRLMIICQLTSALVVLGLVFTNSLALIYTLMALQAACLSVMAPARQAVVPVLVPQSDLIRANAFLQQLASVIKIFAPVLAGVILGLVNPHIAILLDVASFILSAWMLTRLPALPPQRATGSASPASSTSQEPRINPLALLRAVPQLKAVYFSIFLSILVIVAFDVLAPIYIRDVLRQNESFFGLVIGLFGAGTLAATLLLMLRRQISTPWRDVVVGVVLLSVVPLTLSLGATLKGAPFAFWMMVGGCLVGGVGVGLMHVQFNTLIQLLAPAGSLGQSAALMQAFATAGQLCGILLTPLLIPGIFDIASYFLASAIALLVLALALALRNRLTGQGNCINPDFLPNK